MFCNKCGKQIPNDAKFCPECGASLNAQNSQGDEASFGYALLSFFIPVVGLVLFIVWNKEYPKRAKSCLYGIIAGVILWVVFVCCAASRYSEYKEFSGGTTWSEQIEADVFLRCLK